MNDDKRIEKIYFKRYQIYTCMFYVSTLDGRPSIILDHVSTLEKSSTRDLDF